MTIPIVMTAAGAQTRAPLDLVAAATAQAVSLSPGLTADLPGLLIEDLASTAAGALVVIDGALVESINNVTPYGANEYVLNQQGQIYGVQQGVGSNGNAYVVFMGTPGFVVDKGFIVSDGTNQYSVQDGGIVGSATTPGGNGVSAPLFVLATKFGTFPIPKNTITVLATSVPATITLSVNNPTDGIPATTAQTPEQYRAQVLQAGFAAAQGFPSFLKTLLYKIPGVQPRLVSVQQYGSQWQVICGGGDPYLVSGAIFRAVGNPANITGSTLSITAISNANPGVVTTNIAHGYTSGQQVQFSGIQGMMGLNGPYFNATVIDPYRFSIGVDTTALGGYTGGGTVTPNLRNVSVSILDYPDTYVIPFINPLAQAVGITFTWNTISQNFVSSVSIAALATPAIVAYINGIVTGQPINLSRIRTVFESAVAGTLSADLISRMNIVVTLNGQVAAPLPNTVIIPGDALSYFSTSYASVIVTQG